MTSIPGRSIVLADRSAGGVDGLVGALATRGCDLAVADTVDVLCERLAGAAVDAVLLGEHDRSPDEWSALQRATDARDIPLLLLAAADQAHQLIPLLDAGADAVMLAAGGDVVASQVAAHVRWRRAVSAAGATERAVAADALERKEQELSALNYAVSHDLRAPLRAIEGFSRIVLEEAGPNLEARQHDYLQRVCAAAREMGELIGDLLQLSRVGRAELRRGRVDVSELARRVADDLRSRAPQRPVDVAIEDGLVADADRRLLQTVLEQLFGNSWKFTASAADPRIELLARHDGAETTFVVRDNGIGFDMKQAAKLFKPFQRLHGPKEFAGAGIGLAVVHRIVSRHGGHVWAEGAEGSGASVSFTLPPAPGGGAR